MKIIKILAIFVLFQGISHSAALLENLDSNLNKPICNRLSQPLNEFRTNHPQFDYGISSMENLYGSGLNIEELQGSKKTCLFLQEVLFKLEVLANGGCGVLRCLSALHPDLEVLGKILLGCCIGKAVLWGGDAVLHNMSKQTTISLMNAAQTDPLLSSRVSKMIDQINEIDISPVLNVSKKLINAMKQIEIDQDDFEKLARLEKLTNKMNDFSSLRTVIMTGGKVLSFLIGAAAGIAITATGQHSSAAYWLTLIASAVDPIADCINDRFTTKPTVRKYIRVSEIIYLCNRFLSEYGDEIEL